MRPLAVRTRAQGSVRPAPQEEEVGPPLPAPPSLVLLTIGHGDLSWALLGVERVPPAPRAAGSLRVQSAFPEVGRGPSSLGRVNVASRMDGQLCVSLHGRRSPGPTCRPQPRSLLRARQPNARCLALTPAHTQAAQGPHPAWGGLAVSGSVETGESGQDAGTHGSQAMWLQTLSFLGIHI